MTANIKGLILIVLSIGVLPLTLQAERPNRSIQDLRPHIPGNSDANVRSLIRSATPVIPSRQREKSPPDREHGVRTNFFESQVETPTCIVIANATIGSASNVQQNTSVDTLNVNCN